MHSIRFISIARLFLLVSLVSLVALAAPATPIAHAATARYVNPSTGSNASTCANSANPCKTITYALTQSVAGDTVNLAAGTYSVASNGETLPLNITINLTIIGAGTVSTIMDGANTAQVMNIGGGVTVSLSNLTVTKGVGSGGLGGGVSNNGGTLNITNSTFANNSTIVGGGVYNNGGTVNITNSTFANNFCAINGGGVYNDGGTLNITNSTFAYNRSAAGGGSVFSGGSTTLKNTIVANSPSDVNCAGAITNGGNNLQFGGLVADSCGATITIPASDPLGGNSLANNGGPTQTIALPAGSAAINAANPANCPAYDQRGYTRVNTCDIGAYEYGGKIPTTTTLTGPSGSYTSAQSFTFTAAVAQAAGGVTQVSSSIGKTTVRAPAQTGTVTFYDNGAPIPGCSPVALDPVTHVATCTVTLGAGTHMISAVYSGDANFAPSTSTTTLTLNGTQQVVLKFPAEVPEADTLLLFGGGLGGLGVWLRWQWSKRRRGTGA